MKVRRAMLMLLIAAAVWAGDVAIATRFPQRAFRFVYYVSAVKTETPVTFLEQMLVGIIYANSIDNGRRS